MEYRELGPEEKGLSARDLFLLSLQKLEDGTYAQRAFDVGSGSGSSPTIAFTLSSGSVNGDYYFDRIGTPGGNVTWYWALVGGDPAEDYVLYQLNAGEAQVYSGGVEQYAGIGGEVDPVTPDPTTIPVWFATGGSEPTPTFS